MKKKTIDLSLFNGGHFQYEYQSRGKDVTIDVLVHEEEFLIDGQSIGLKEDDFIGCEDIDDCSLVIGRHIIRDNDGEILTRYIDEDGNTLTGHSYMKRMNKNLEFINDNNDDSWYLSLCGNYTTPVVQFNICEITDDEFEDVSSMFEKNDEECLFDYVMNSDSVETVEVFQTWGDTEDDRLSYELTDNNGQTVNEGVLLVSETNIFEYSDHKPEYLIKRSNHPRYILFHGDMVKDGLSVFRVPKDFNIGEIHFTNSNPIEDRILDFGLLGDSFTNISSFRYQGKVYSSVEETNNGTYGDNHYCLFEWSERKERYIPLYEI